MNRAVTRARIPKEEPKGESKRDTLGDQVEKRRKEQGARRNEMQPKRDEKHREIQFRKAMTLSQRLSGLIGFSSGGEVDSATPELGLELFTLFPLPSDVSVRLKLDYTPATVF
jgi:hypothetical protein